MHGEAHPVFHRGVGIFRGLPSPLLFTRYHSLAVKDPRASVLAWTVASPSGEHREDGVIQALWDGKVAYGVQFHPESLLSEWGLVLLDRFLEVGFSPSLAPSGLEPPAQKSGSRG